MQVDARERRFVRRDALREQRADQAAEHVAGAARGERGVAGWVDRHAAVGCRNHRARAFQHDDRRITRGKRLRGRDAVPLHGGRVAAEQTRGFERMRRQHARMAVRAAGGDGGREIRVRRDEVQRVGIEQRRGGVREHIAHEGRRGLAHTESAAGGERGHRIEIEAVGRVQHQFGERRVVRRRAGAKEADVHLAGAGEQRGARGQDRRAAHAGIAAEHRQAAVRTLVGRMRARGQRRHEPRGRIQHDGRRGGRRDVERCDVDRAREVAAVARVEARFRADEGERVGGRDGDTRADDPAGIAVEPARHVEGEHPAAVARMRGDPRGLLGECAVERAAETDAEQPVDDPRVFVQRGGRCGRQRHAGRAGEAERPLRVVRLDRYRHPRLRRDTELLEVRGGHQRVAAVVAGADREPDGAVVAGDALGQPVRGGGARAAHQRVRRQRRGGVGFGRAQVGDAQQRDRVGIGKRAGNGHRGIVAAGKDAATGRARVAVRGEAAGAERGERVGGPLPGVAAQVVGHHFSRPACEAPAGRAMAEVDEHARMRVGPTTGRPSGDSSCMPCHDSAAEILAAPGTQS